MTRVKGKVCMLGFALGVHLFGLAQPQQLSGFSCDVRKIDPSSAIVSANIAMQVRPSPAPASLVIRLSGSEQLKNLTIREAAGKASQPAIASFPAGIRFNIRGSGPWNVTYLVSAAPKELTRVPLPVPSMPPPAGSKMVQLSLHLQKNEVAFGDLFPSMIWPNSENGSASLLSVPSVLIFHSRPTAHISMRDRILTLDNMADVGMLVLLLLGLGRLSVYLSRPKVDKAAEV